jgi:hypothetical protein
MALAVRMIFGDNEIMKNNKVNFHPEAVLDENFSKAQLYERMLGKLYFIGVEKNENIYQIRKWQADRGRNA